MKTPQRCFACGGDDLFDLFQLGEMPPVNGFSATSNQENAFPLDVRVCLRCWLCQLKSVPDSSLLFRDYKHFSSASKGNLLHLQEVADVAEQAMFGRSAVKVLEIGCNDGSLLEILSKKGYQCIGVDPATSMKSAHRGKNLTVIHEFFDEDLAGQVLKTEGQFDLIIGLNVLAHFPAFMSAYRGIRTLMKPDGLLHLEVADATETLANGRFDTIYHEHVCNYTLTSINAVLRLAGLRGIHAEKIDTQGGSLRVLACKNSEFEQKDTYRTLLNMDRAEGVNTKDFYLAVKEKTEATISTLNRAYSEFCAAESPVVLLGAPARGVVMCNSTVLKNMRNLYCVDDTPAKQGCVIPGTEIPVGDWGVIAATAARRAILLSWNYRESMIERLIDTGFAGQVLIPLPKTDIVTDYGDR